MSVGECEYTKNVVKALKDAIIVNDKLTEMVQKLAVENDKMKEELNEKDNVIQELAQYYKVNN